MQISYSSPIGIIKINGDHEAIHSVSFFDGGQTDLDDEPTPVMGQCLQELTEYFGGTRKEFNVAISQMGTGFQQEVWAALTTVPFGQTVSYLRIARMVGNENSIRAVGAANGKNNLAIIVPCHRVIGNNGKLVGYMGGLWRKKWLLDHEARIAHGVLQLF